MTNQLSTLQNVLQYWNTTPAKTDLYCQLWLVLGLYRSAVNHVETVQTRRTIRITTRRGCLEAHEQTIRNWKQSALFLVEVNLSSASGKGCRGKDTVRAFSRIERRHKPSVLQSSEHSPSISASPFIGCFQPVSYEIKNQIQLSYRNHTE